MTDEPSENKNRLPPGGAHGPSGIHPIIACRLSRARAQGHPENLARHSELTNGMPSSMQFAAQRHVFVWLD